MLEEGATTHCMYIPSGYGTGRTANRGGRWPAWVSNMRAGKAGPLPPESEGTGRLEWVKTETYSSSDASGPVWTLGDVGHRELEAVFRLVVGRSGWLVLRGWVWWFTHWFLVCKGGGGVH